MSGTGEAYNVQPVVKALHVLDYVARQGREVTLTETVQALGLPKTTVFRYLQTLSNEGFLQYDLRRDRYSAGERFRVLGRIDQDLQGLRSAARPEMAQLQEAFRETVNLAVLSDSVVVYLDILEPGRPSSQARVGHRDPVYSTSLGKAISAHMPEGDLPPIWGGLEPRTINTLTDPGRLRRQVDDVRRRGYAVEVGENEDGLMCIGVPILDTRGYPLAAMSLSGPEGRMRPEIVERAAGALREAAARISSGLGRAVAQPAA